ncbi:hypothetical protein UFOVP1009_26 [uncultured Caudovirales phage]|uniref:Uncharacterized protein n=1 Tax=uncultured Caudovirales phage TaxID=2100421 RepID=A0A6J5Q1L8_9CAUD|nr:hypothetical protein UFOVP1009_26 [uncultured Caudovirales phage]
MIQNMNINQEQFLSIISPFIDNIKSLTEASPENRQVELLKILNSVKQFKTTGANNGKTT